MPPKMYEEKYQPNIAGALLWFPAGVLGVVIILTGTLFDAVGIPHALMAAWFIAVLIGIVTVFASAFLVMAPMFRYARDLYQYESKCKSCK